MESRKRMDYGFQGYQAPPLPRAMRSARGRGAGSRKKNDDENGMVFFELLATVAGNLLQQQEAQKEVSAVQGVNSFDHSEEEGNDLREEESSAEQALLELDKSRIFPPGNDVQRLDFSTKGTKVEPDDQGSSDENTIASGATHWKFAAEELPIKEDPDMSIQTVSKSVSSIHKLDCLRQSSLDNEKVLGMCINTQAANERPMQGISLGDVEDKKGYCTDKERFCTNDCKGKLCLLSHGQGLPESADELAKETLGLVENGEGKGENEIDESKLGHWKRKLHVEDESMHDANSLPASSAVSEETPMSTDTKPPALVSSGSSEDLPVCAGSKPRDSFFNSPNKRIKVCRDDDDNSSGCTTPSRITKNLFKNKYVRGAKLRRSLSKIRQAVSASSIKRKHSEIMSNNTGTIVKGGSLDSGEGFTGQRTVRCSPFKRKRLAKETFSSDPDLHASTASATCLDSNGVDGDPPVCASKIRRAKLSSVASSPMSAAGSSKHSSKKAGDSLVKLSIKSFTIPELFIDMPESATVASLKRAVMEAAMNLLGDGLRVCVLLQGKKLPDESDTLHQLGKSHGGKLDSVGFMLEPNPTSTSQACTEDPLFLLSRAATKTPPRYPTTSTSAQTSVTEGNKSVLKGRSNKTNGTASAEVAVSPAGRTQTDTNQYAKSEYETTTDSLVKTGALPGTLIVHPSIATESAQGLALVPLNHKNPCSELGKRRIRRPFTVNEVEALVQAVEKLGTGRWRDVKLRAFEHAKHRTYVDLKDKWKTLVHTAKIAPHQRRGEPVPQDLLDRVIHAHNYWADEQVKQQAELCL
ncbi:hypothetical protein SUGI_0001010 [Cryptomeria japonica]|uniref:telomere repeat-binding protein 5 n=1 Tax=Cryptomeria japonica TaxID=3369 RepID=UPI002408DAE9|nr:telomere repeat-binding protein 5 [Cryptomeria japonica]XP_057824512.2 telomere repeat-binding protein 5 [Cryptomeria japonica]XP_057824513.2 telomere repeat-binding protein 5 [Cryptomeria japonica]XP_057824514.2 telomere repeat-binding protein 5 [Cryptomeria japonica]GLJ04672.1 hypothetical protein SUGI_0001010 [Cryptomeria japonica]